MTDAIPMIPEDNPLIELAAKLGYLIFLETSAEGGVSHRYQGVSQGKMYYDTQLPDLISQLITGDLEAARAQAAQAQAQAQPLLASGMAEQLQVQVNDQQILIKELERTITDLKRQLDLEYRYLRDSQARGFVAFLRRQPQTTLTQKILANSRFTVLTPQAGRWTYEHMLRHEMHCTDAEMEEFKELWKLLLLETSRNRS